MMNLLVLIYIVCCFSHLGFDSTIELNCKNPNLEFIEDRNEFFFFFGIKTIYRYWLHGMFLLDSD